MGRSLYILFFIACSLSARAQDEITDTVLNPNKLVVPSDSIRTWKQLKAFEYASYLDSLLKEQLKKQAQEKIEHPKEKPGGDNSGSTSKSEPIIFQKHDRSWLDGVFQSAGLRWVLYSLAILFVLFVIYKLFFADGGFKKKLKRSPVVAQPQAEEEEVLTHESDFDRFIRLALQSGNYRLAVRYQYLRILTHLAQRNYIEMAADKTNYQYLRELQTHGVDHQFQNEFASLTLSYEYAWYGEFNVDDQMYRKIETGFKNFNKRF